MRAFTAERTPDSPDEIWLLEHEPVFTLGQAGDPQHILEAGDIPVLACDRGGQVTYHGPGQLVMYTLINLRRAGLGVRDLVTLLENSVIEWLARYTINATSRRDAPGVYVDGAKIAALGLRISRGFSYHGVALNVNVDLAPYSRINPCGFVQLPVTSLQELGVLEKLPSDSPAANPVHASAAIQSSNVDVAENNLIPALPVVQTGVELADVFCSACYPATSPAS